MNSTHLAKHCHFIGNALGGGGGPGEGGGGGGEIGLRAAPPPILMNLPKLGTPLVDSTNRR